MRLPFLRVRMGAASLPCHADEAEALALYAALFPGKTIGPLNANRIIASAGAWHCVAMECPAP